jgi:hypothetical protein
MTTVAVMQPYFIPYSGYFSLMLKADIFVLYDCVQFPRRGWVHRNRLTDTQGNLKWLTLPLEYMPQSARITELRFDNGGRERLNAQLASFSVLRQETHLYNELLNVDQSFVDYVESWLSRLASILGIHFNPVRSSSLNLSLEFKNQDRILALCQHFGATKYLNAAGGTELYTPAAFHQRGIELAFLKPWQGSQVSMLERVIRENPREIRHELEHHVADLYYPR